MEIKRSDVKTTLPKTHCCLSGYGQKRGPKSCLLIPSGDIPSEFFELLDGKLEGTLINS